jgi:hypothetical protein
MKRAFELEWMGGAAEHFFRKARPGIDEMPWGTLDTSGYPPEVVDAARATWTESAYTEYRAVAAFSDVLRAMCAAGAPLDLIGMASGFVADEVVHVELASRMAMELGGAVERPVDYADLYPTASPSLTPLERCNETVLRVSCIAEALSGALAVHSLRETTHPLTRAVLERIVADESLHHRLGALYFEWASEEMSDAERARLSAVAARSLRTFAPMFRARRDPRSGRFRASPEQIRDIGWIDARVYGQRARAAVLEGIVAPLASYGIAVPEDELTALFAGTDATADAGRAAD